MLSELLNEQENKFLSRREVSVKFKDIKGTLTRADAAATVAQRLNIDRAKVFPISIHFEAGVDSAEGLFYVYDNPELAKKHIPKYLMFRSLPKEERKKVIEESKKAKQATPAAAAVAPKK